MALVTLATAKDHLRIPPDDHDHDADINTKLDQASGIVLDYLGNRRIAIETISAANPAVVTTSAPHSLANGVTYTLADTVTTPTVNGARVITVTGQTTFTVPVNVTAGQGKAAGTVSSAVWSDTNATAMMTASTLIALSDLYENRQTAVTAETWQAIERLLMRSRDPVLA